MTGERWRWALLAVFGVTTLVHFPAVGNYLDNDDAWNYVLEADRVLSGQGSAWVQDGGYLAHQNLFRLVPSLSWIPRFGAGGLWMPAWHAPSILVHGLNAVLLVLVCVRFGLTQSVGLLAGLLFGLSPMHPHTVSWIGGTYDLFCGAFLMGALLAFADRRLVLGLACTAGAMMSKEMGILTGPLLALYWLLFERGDGWRAGLIRLWPYAAVAVVVAGLRLLQIQLAGSIEQAGLPARTLGFDAAGLVVTGPAAILAGLGRPLLEVAPLSPQVFGLVFGGLLLAVLAARGRLIAHPASVFGMVAAWLLLVPVLLMREEGAAMTAEDIVFNARYLYLSLLVAMPLVSLAVLGNGESSHLAGRAIAVGAVAFSLVLTGRSVLVLTQVEPAAEVVADGLLAEPLPDGANVFVLTNTYDEGPFRLVLSRWLQEATGGRYHWVQRGTWRSIQRDPERLTGLDFKDFYVQVERRPFDPEAVVGRRGDRVFLLSHGGAGGRHSLVPIESLSAKKPERGRVQALEAKWVPVSADGDEDRLISVQPHIRADGSVQLRVAGRVDRPGGWVHRPAIRTQDLWLPARQVMAFRIRYTATGPGPRPGDRRYAWGYAELHWRAEKLAAQDTFLTIPIALTGQPTEAILPVWFDPAWVASGTVQWLGFHPLDDSGQVTLHGIDIIYRK